MSSSDLSDQEFHQLLRALYLEYFINLQKENDQQKKEIDDLKKQNENFKKQLLNYGDFCPCGQLIPFGSYLPQHDSGRCKICRAPFCGYLVGCRGSSIYYTKGEDKFCKSCGTPELLILIAMNLIDKLKKDKGLD